jgi:hypothetical protein
MYLVDSDRFSGRKEEKLVLLLHYLQHKQSEQGDYMGRRPSDLTGQTFNYLTVLEKATQRGHYSYFQCKCKCGTIKEVRGSNLISQQTKSCGCLLKETLTKHGKTGTPAYLSWKAMNTRCNNRKFPRYIDYGARGIRVCDRWRGKDGFKNFFTDLGERPKGYSLDRINNDGNYEPENCRWSDKYTQANNARSNNLITYKNQTKTLSQWARVMGLGRYTLSCRIYKYNWSIEKALMTPVSNKNQ